jgi:hypothetical protein
VKFALLTKATPPWVEWEQKLNLLLLFPTGSGAAKQSEAESEAKRCFFAELFRKNIGTYFSDN